jgi:hypothetical protein
MDANELPMGIMTSTDEEVVKPMANKRRKILP